ncbi:MAG: M14 family zinc carboxypeptidase [Solirubrobacteraceae bacterium]
MRALAVRRRLTAAFAAVMAVVLTATGLFVYKRQATNLDRLASGPPPRRPAIWIIPDLNPDGVAAGTRQNAHHVDLNRNFPFRWRPLGHQGDQQCAGPRALSEPESRLTPTLILRLPPRLTTWFHQPLAITDRSGGDARIEARFAALSRLPLTRLPLYPGSVATWENNQR